MSLDPMTIWTRFQVPIIVDLYNGTPQNSEANLETENSEIWSKGIEALTKAPGHVVSVWGRILERPDEIQMITCWEKKSAVSEFEESLAYGTYWSAISLYGPPTMTLRAVSYGQSIMYHQLPAYVHMRTVHFPKSLTEEQRLAVMKINGLVDISWTSSNVGRLRGRNQPHPWREWVEGEREWGGETVESMLNLYFWKDAEAEAYFMKNQMATVETQAVSESGNTYTVYGERLLAVDLWERQLKEAGAVGWVDEHFKFEHKTLGGWTLEKVTTDESERMIILPQKGLEYDRELIKQHIEEGKGRPRKRRIR